MCRIIRTVGQSNVKTAYDTREPGDVKGMQVLEKAYEMGKAI